MGDEKMLKEMGIRINERRKELKMTQETLAEKMDVSIQMISNLELGKKAIRPENIVKLCEALDVSTDYILLGKRSQNEVLDTLKEFNRLNTPNQRLVEELIRALLQK